MLLTACLGVPDTPTSPPAQAAAVVEQHGRIRSETGCAIDYTLYRGEDGAADPRVVLAHGFLRGKEHMRGLARRLARHGLATATLDLCNMRPWNGAHRQNGRDMRRLARRLGGDGPVVYAGFSAGGLAALVAAAQDARAAGVLAMDLVDRDGLGRRLAADLQIPLLGLVADPSPCNAQNNGLAVYAAAPRARTWRIRGATHCDFETPTDALCRLVCERGDRPARQVEAIRRQIIDRALGAIAGMSDAG